MAVKTYWHLAELGRRPNDYDVATSRLLYYPGRGFETEVPLSAWYRTYQTGSPAQCRDWDGFRDPRETTYAGYVELQQREEAFVDAVLAAGEDRELAPAWRDTLARVLPVLRFPIHGLQMLAGYVGHMAPGGRIAIACALQAADEVRRIQRFAYRTCELGLADHGRASWEQHAAWQPLRAVIERLMIVRDWGEAFVALSLVVKPRFDELVAGLAPLARAHGDDTFANVVFSLAKDAAWHVAWSRELERVMIEDRESNAAAIAGWRAAWEPPAEHAIAALAEAFR